MDTISAMPSSLPAGRSVASSLTALGRLDEEARAEYWAALALRRTKGLGPRSICRLLKHFGSAYKAVYGLADWGKAGVPVSKGAGLAGDGWRREARPEWEDSRDLDAHVLLWTDPRYPALLRELPDAPALLYARGDLTLLSSTCVGVVGSRACSRKNLHLTHDVSRELAACGITVVSGMARGIDYAAHTAALPEKGRTIGVLGAGIDIIYPPEHKDLYHAVGVDGLLISEFAPGTRPTAPHFPIRNRIISGLSLGVLVVEAAQRSGSLITARLALEQNRAVYAVPSTAKLGQLRDDTASAHSDAMAPIMSEDGCINLLEQGARPALCAADILVDLFPQLMGILHTVPRQTSEPVGGQTQPLRPRTMAAPIPVVEASPVAKTAAKTRAARPDQSDTLPSHKVSPVFAVDSPEGLVLALLKQQGPLLIDDLLTRLTVSGWGEQDAGKLSAQLLVMEIRGVVRRLPGAIYEAL